MPESHTSWPAKKGKGAMPNRAFEVHEASFVFCIQLPRIYACVATAQILIIVFFLSHNCQLLIPFIMTKVINLIE